MDFVTQQYKLFSHLSALFALHFSAAWLWELYNKVTAELDQGELKRLPEVKYCIPIKSQIFHSIRLLINLLRSSYTHLHVASRQSQLRTLHLESKSYDSLVVVMDI